ncbi:MAG: GbsR/MarR family transcriptional regulator [Halococcoides sp.]
MAADDISPEVQEARETMLDAFARTADIYGANRSTGRLYGILYFADEPLSLDTLADRSEYAKSTVSTAMSTLERYHMVHRRSMPGEGKKAYFEAETDFWRVLQAFLTNEVRREIHTMSRALEDAIAALESADTERAKRDREKLQSLKRLYDRSERAVDVLTSTSAERVLGVLDRL